MRWGLKRKVAGTQGRKAPEQQPSAIEMSGASRQRKSVIATAFQSTLAVQYVGYRIGQKF
jgi:hypothetical protein